MNPSVHVRSKNVLNRSGGFTLIEVMVATLVAMVVFTALGALTVFTSRSFVALANYNDLDEASQNALDTLSREIRMTRSLASYAPNKLVFVDFDGATNLTYEWIAPSGSTPGVLTRTKGNTTTTLLKQCDYLSFGISQRNWDTNAAKFYVTTNAPIQTKLVDISWRCSRQILQKKVNTESVQTAKIVIRN